MTNVNWFFPLEWIDICLLIFFINQNVITARKTLFETLNTCPTMSRRIACGQCRVSHAHLPGLKPKHLHINHFGLEFNKREESDLNKFE